MRRAGYPIFLLPGTRQPFPDPKCADDEGLVAVGGDLAPERLLQAYEKGLFPWFEEGMPPLWWSPNPRTIIEAGDLHVSKSLARTMRRKRLRCSLNRAFRDVMVACADRQEGTWICPEMISAYTALHVMGSAHSFEVWSEGALVGGLYGVQIGGLFAAESMFHRITDASKVALVTAHKACFGAGIRLFDVQFLTEHLRSMGAREIPRALYLARVRGAVHRKVDLESHCGSLFSGSE